jgi:hypothetical protein
MDRHRIEIHGVTNQANSDEEPPSANKEYRETFDKNALFYYNRRLNIATGESVSFFSLTLSDAWLFQ